MALHQVRLLRRVHAYGDVGLTHREVEVGVVEQQGHRDVGIHLEEGLQPRGKPGRAETHRRRHLQPPGRLLLAFREQGLGHRELGEHLAHRAVQALALLRQNQAAGMAVEQRHLQRLLQRRDLAGYGGLAEVQRFARMGEAAGLGNGMEDPQLIPIHAYPVPPSIRSR